MAVYSHNGCNDAQYGGGVRSWSGFINGCGDFGLERDVTIHPDVLEWPIRQGGFLVGGLYSEPALWGIQQRVSGSSLRKEITGIAYDVNEDPISGATVLLFVTSTRAFLESVTSDANGRYTILIPYDSTQYFLAGFGTDVSGVTDDTITGA
jgi:hypothetical protein